LRLPLREVVHDVVTHFARIVALPDGPELRQRLVEWLDDASDERRERYLELLAVINGWPAPDESLAANLDWARKAVTARL